MAKQHDKPQAQATATKDGDREGADLFIAYPAASRLASLSEMLNALYYLPHNYKLVLPADSLGKADDDLMAWVERELLDRVRFSADTSESGKAANITLYDQSQPADTEVRSVFISPDARQALQQRSYGYTVWAGSPEALASAILRLTRTPLAV